MFSEEGDEQIVSYVNIYNPNNYGCYYNRLCLSSDEDNLYEKLYENVVIPSNKIYTLYFDLGDVDFSSKSETVLYLSSTMYEDVISKVSVPPLYENEIYENDIDSGQWYIKSPNDSRNNNKIVEMPSFSIEGGFYDEPFYLYINAPKDTTVYYTLDCTDPNKKTNKYNNEPIYVYDKSNEQNLYRSISCTTSTYLTEDPATYEPVDKCFVVRAVAINKDGISSDINTQSYFINMNKYSNKNVVSVVTDPDNLFSSDSGIYVTGHEYDEWLKTLSNEELKSIDMKGRVVVNNTDGTTSIINGPDMNYSKHEHNEDWEREANFELFDKKQIISNQGVGIRIQSNTTRYNSLGFKPFSIFSRKQYGSAYFTDELFKDSDILTDNIKLKNNRSAICHYFMKDRNVTVSLSKPIILFIDGEFWEESYMLTKYSETFYAETYNLLKNNIQESHGTFLYEQSNEPAASFLISIIENIDSYDYDSLNKIIDVQSYIDMICSHFFFSNNDFCDYVNVAVWKTKFNENSLFGDGRLRWSLDDLDHYFSSVDWNPWLYSSNGVINHFVNDPNNNYRMPILYHLEKYDEFKKQFVNTMMDLINDYYTIDKIWPLFDEWWKSEYDYYDYINSFLKQRPIYLTKYMEEELNLSGITGKIKLETNNKNAGIIRINTITPNIGNCWSGVYYVDYPIELSVKENDGYLFNHWEVNGEYFSNEKTINVNVVEGTTSINAIYN